MSFTSPSLRNRALIAFGVLALPVVVIFHSARADRESEEDHSIALFLETAKVFRHPRCLNCHPAGDQPLQGLDSHRHIMNVQRGPDDHGAIAMKCASCHNDTNNPYSGVPGAPKWALAPKSMAWVGLSDRELCMALKDKRKTHKTMAQMIDHNANDPLVAWGWDPGHGREPAPGTQKEFGRIFAEWVATGAHCPKE